MLEYIPDGFTLTFLENIYTALYFTKKLLGWSGNTCSPLDGSSGAPNIKEAQYISFRL